MTNITTITTYFLVISTIILLALCCPQGYYVDNYETVIGTIQGNYIFIFIYDITII